MVPNYDIAIGSVGMHPTPLMMSSLNATNIGRVKRGLVAMGCVVDVVRVVLPNIKRGRPERGRWHSNGSVNLVSKFDIAIGRAII